LLVVNHTQKTVSVVSSNTKPINQKEAYNTDTGLKEIATDITAHLAHQAELRKHRQAFLANYEKLNPDNKAHVKKIIEESDDKSKQKAFVIGVATAEDPNQYIADNIYTTFAAIKKARENKVDFSTKVVAISSEEKPTFDPCDYDACATEINKNGLTTPLLLAAIHAMKIDTDHLLESHAVVLNSGKIVPYTIHEKISGYSEKRTVLTIESVLSDNPLDEAFITPEELDECLGKINCPNNPNVIQLSAAVKEPVEQNYALLQFFSHDSPPKTYDTRVINLSGKKENDLPIRTLTNQVISCSDLHLLQPVRETKYTVPTPEVPKDESKFSGMRVVAAMRATIHEALTHGKADEKKIEAEIKLVSNGNYLQKNCALTYDTNKPKYKQLEDQIDMIANNNDSAFINAVENALSVYQQKNRICLFAKPFHSDGFTFVSKAQERLRDTVHKRKLDVAKRIAFEILSEKLMVHKSEKDNYAINTENSRTKCLLTTMASLQLIKITDINKPISLTNFKKPDPSSTPNHVTLKNLSRKDLCS
jgi:hypothetical protein